MKQKHILQPKLRFPEFDGDWKKSKLNKFAEINPKVPSIPDVFIYIDLESVINGRLIAENIINKENAPSRAIRTLSKNDILFQTVRPYQKNNLLFNIDSNNYVASTGYAQIRTSNNSQFLYQYLHIDDFNKRVLLRCTGTSYPAINSGDLGEIDITFPSLPEQQKIADYLSTIDAKISLLEEKKTELSRYKKAMMQKLFSQEIRFKPSEAEALEAYPEWEEKRLGEVFTGLKGQGLSKESLSYEGENNCILYGELFTKYNEIIKSVISKTDSLANVISKKGDVLIPASTTTNAFDLANATALLLDNVILGGDINILRPKQKVSSEFYAYYLSNFKKHELGKLGQGITIVHLYYTHFKNIMIDLPSLPEQQKIADFLSAIDASIEKVNEQISQTQSFKKAMLQQLFV